MSEINEDLIMENLGELLTNTVDMTSVFYDIFLNPEPMMVHLKAFDKDNKLIDVEIPNRAQDRIVPYMGSGSPEGKIAAPVGSTYVDTKNSTVYYKVSGSADDPFGWNGVLSQSVMEEYIRVYLASRGYITTSSLGAYVYKSITDGVVPNPDPSSEEPGRSIKATTSSFGVVKYDSVTIGNNSNSQLQVNGFIDKNSATSRGIWTGVENNGSNVSFSPNPSNISFLTDVGQILVGDMVVASNAFPSNTHSLMTLGASGVSYIAPTNGWLLLGKVAGAANSYINISNTDTGYANTMIFASSSDTGYVVCPAVKGESLVVNYNATGETVSFIFIYAASNRYTSTND